MSKVYFAHTSKLEITKLGIVPASTIAIKKEGDNFFYGISICSKQDNFSKSFGREQAEKRLNEHFGILPVPQVLLKSSLTEQKMCLEQLRNLVSSVVTRQRKWKKRVTRFNKGLGNSFGFTEVTV